MSGHPGIDRASDEPVVGRLHVRSPLQFPARRPKKRGPFQFVPVMANAISERLSKVFPSKGSRLQRPSPDNVAHFTPGLEQCRAHRLLALIPGR